jgi:signal transduction histidine kinase
VTALAARVRPRIGPWLAALLLASLAAALQAAVIEPDAVDLLVASDATPPASGRPWQRVPLPDLWPRARPQQAPTVAWYRTGFDVPAATPAEPWAVYLPFLYGGGQVWLNGAKVGQLTEDSAQVHVRWARPHLVALPSAMLQPGRNELFVRAAVPQAGVAMAMPRLVVGPLSALQPLHERRFFWVSVTPYITAAVCLLTAAFVLFVWWRRPGEVLYGLFGLATALWGVRTLTFVIEVVPQEWWLAWRVVYLGATGGFIVAMAVLALRYADRHRPWLERALFAYWLLGPAWLLAQGAPAEALVNRYWVAGFLPVGIGILVMSVWTLLRERTLASAVLPAAMAIAVLAGLHDYAVNWNVEGTHRILGAWADDRIFLLHHAANLILLAMGALLTARFIHALGGLEDLNRTLESRVAERERQLAENFASIAELQRTHAAAQERQLIMREIHDGLGSQLFVSLSRAERGDMQLGQMADILRGCIADMRIALDTLTPGEDDFRATFGNFLFRWQQQLAACGIRPSWTIDVPDRPLSLAPHAALSLLRIAQEALTNVVKHAGAQAVHVRLRETDGVLALEIEDDGVGPRPNDAPGRGIVNMRARAGQLGGTLDVRAGPGGTCVALQLPVNTVRA